VISVGGHHRPEQLLVGLVRELDRVVRVKLDQNVLERDGLLESLTADP
jgi:hypothetical protein